MRRFFIYFIAILWGIQFSPTLADEWLDIAEDIQKQIITEVPISPDDQKQIDINLLWANQCVNKELECPTDNEKQSIRETVKQLENLWRKYQDLDIKSPVLEYVVGKAGILRAMTQEDVPPMWPVVTDIILQVYYQDALQTYDTIYDREVAQKTEKHQNALKFLPEGTVIPSVPGSKTHQAIVIDLSDQRLYAFEDEMLVYTNPITSGKNWYATVRWDFSVMTKQRNRLLRSPFKGISYNLHVDYWIQFYPKYGIHDACNSKSCWRKEFGGSDYTSRGSHGCVNSPYEAVKWLYEWALEGTAVRVQK